MRSAGTPTGTVRVVVSAIPVMSFTQKHAQNIFSEKLFPINTPLSASCRFFPGIVLPKSCSPGPKIFSGRFFPFREKRKKRKEPKEKIEKSTISLGNDTCLGTVSLDRSVADGVSTSLYLISTILIYPILIYSLYTNLYALIYE